MGGRGSLGPADVSVAQRDAQMQMEHPRGALGDGREHFCGSCFVSCLSIRFKVSGNMDSESCGVVKANQTNSETCQAEFKWICEREGIEM